MNMMLLQKLWLSAAHVPHFAAKQGPAYQCIFIWTPIYIILTTKIIQVIDFASIFSHLAKHKSGAQTDD